ncbi:COPII coat assembly protein sec16 [Decorospora gaudefroyi]|uniref:Protein transport protein sec16 n=1 Tax=Decorospora gaudefroyi TaxID=184978 RepID=A0A6A5K0A3_9PLEO|nr:COPII coat assembly protein sec16 [Decorospora gaudefroyi]
MDNDDGPNFSYAYGGTPSTPSTASWNPALRSDKEAAPPARAKPPTQPEPASSEDEDEEDEEEEESDEDSDDESRHEEAAPSVPAVAAAHAPPAPAPASEDSSDDEEADDHPQSHNAIADAPQSAQQPRATATGEGRVGGAGDEHVVNATQALNSKEHPKFAKPESSDEEDSEEEEDEEESSDEEADPAEHPEENYERQGETTALEEALTQSAKVPLVADTEADEWGGSGDDPFDLVGKAQEAPLEIPHTEALGTTVGDDTIGNTVVGGNAGADIDWGTTEEQEDFFGAGASQQIEPAQSVHGTPGAYVVQPEAKPAEKSEWDLDLDLDDDFLPDKEEAPAFELSDDDGFLEDEAPVPEQQPSQPTPPGTNSASRYAPQGASLPSAASPAANPYAPQAPVAPTYNGFGQNVAYLQQQQQQQARPPIATSAQSFADKAKGGYASPYDLPEDIVTSRKRPAPRSTVSAVQPALPPPRTSSMSSNAGPPRPPMSSSMSVSSLSPPSSGQSMRAQMTGMPPGAPVQPAVTAKSPSSDFFAELPVTSKPRPSGRYTPQQNMPVQPPAHQAPPQLPSKERTGSWSSLRNEFLPDAGNVATPPPFRHPEQLPMFPSQPSVPTRTNSLPVPQPAPAPPSSRYSPAPPPAGPAANARYSPAPPTAPVANARYSPAPSQGSQGQPHARYASEPHNNLNRTPSQPFAPRTSSPLAFHSMPHHQGQIPEGNIHAPNHHVSQSADGMPRPPFRSPLGEVSEIEEQETTLSSRPPTAGRSETPPAPRSTASSVVGSPRKRENYAPRYQPTNAPPPQRSHSQSPTASMKQPTHSLSTEHIGTAYGMMPPPASYRAHPTTTGTMNVIPHRRQASLNYSFIVPEDEHAVDPLERWKGHPVFTWGLGGTVMTSFPKQIPRYGGGGSAPMMKSSPGEIRIQSIKEVLPLTEDVAKFPGPLKAKGKKKDVSAWLGRKIESLEAQSKDPGLEHSMSEDDVKRLDDRILLWKLMQILLDNDGRVEGSAAEAAVKKLLSPGGDETSDADALYSTAVEMAGRSRSNTSNLQAEPSDPRAIEDLQSMLIKGDREKAVWHAVDQRLWGHAMLLSSTLSKETWKQVVQEFVRKEVKKVGRNNQELAVLYEVFAGNHEDCVDELVPASARAGFQMMSADGAGPTQNALQGLDKWRETVALIMNNRSEGDASALLSLGRLLAQYGRVEAAHICFIFARLVVKVGGVDDTTADLVLIGADHHQHPLELGVDLEPILLTEVYEFALSLSSQGGSHVMPHLQNYKLAHAYHLAENGYRADAQAYCDAIASAMKATTKISPYYNAAFIASLDDLGKRLSQSPKDGSSSWISKPSMDKVGSSLLSKFNSFIAGDDESDVSNRQGGAEVGPFAKIAGDSPSLTPSQSNTDLYGAMSGYAVPAQPSAPTNSRYAPSNAYTPRSSSDQQRSRYEPQGRPSMESNDGFGTRAVSDNHMPMTPTTGLYSPTQNQLSPQTARTQAKVHSYSPLRPEFNAAQPSYGSPYMPTPPETSAAPAFGGYQPQASFDNSAQPTNTEVTNDRYGPSSSTFEAPSYQPYNPDEDDKETEQQLNKKKSFMYDDEDDDLAARASALKISGASSKSEADKKADEAFRKAAEADAARDKEAAAAKKGGWLSGWFKKDTNAGPGPIKAKLGEESSFVYDTDLGKWVNKKGGATDTGKPAATPPPPRAGPPGGRSTSGSAALTSAPSMGPPGAGALRPPTSNPRSSSMPPPMHLPGSRASTPGIPESDEEGLAGPKPPALARPSFGAASGPPSRPGTGMSNASSIDDLLGAPQARKGPASKKKKGGRYVDVMAK